MLHVNTPEVELPSDRRSAEVAWKVQVAEAVEVEDMNEEARVAIEVELSLLRPVLERVLIEEGQACVRVTAEGRARRLEAGAANVDDDSVKVVHHRRRRRGDVEQRAETAAFLGLTDSRHVVFLLLARSALTYACIVSTRPRAKRVRGVFGTTRRRLPSWHSYVNRDALAT